MPRGRPPKLNEQPTPQTYWDKLSQDTQSKQSKLSLVLGALIVLVVGILVFNYFSKSQPSLGPAQTTQTQEGDVSPENLPGKYTVKEGDTLFAIAQNYYNDGYKYPEIAKANSLTNPDLIDTGQILEIPKIETIAGQDSQLTDWGPKITGNTYEVVEGDWLSKIAGKTYGDIYAYDKIAKANNIQNPDLIEPGMVLTIPR